MRGRLFAGLSLGTLFCILCVGLLSRCFSPSLPICAFLCGPPDMNPRCPQSYECRNDGVCHLIGSGDGPDMCPFTVDLLPAPDLSSDGGLGDGSAADGAAHDGSPRDSAADSK